MNNRWKEVFIIIFKKKRDFTISESGTDTVEQVLLGGVNQSILIQAENLDNPVLLFVHGGPCMPVPGVVSRGQDYAIAISTSELIKHFVVVFWDQRAAGKSFHKSIPADSIRVEQYIKDGIELIDILRKRFARDRIFLAGHSWGTVISLSIAANHPEKLHAYVGISQIINWQENDLFCYNWLTEKAETANDTKTLQRLEKLGKPPYVDNVKQWIDFRNVLMKYKSMIYESDTVKHPGLLAGVKIFLNAADYSLLDLYHTFRSAYNLTYTQDLIEDFAKIDFKDINKLNVPVFFLHGKHDLHLDGNPVIAFVENLDAPYGKEFVWYEKSSHMFHPDDTKEMENYLIKTVRDVKMPVSQV